MYSMLDLIKKWIQNAPQLYEKSYAIMKEKGFSADLYLKEQVLSCYEAGYSKS
jgi:hypothetical protein